MRHYKNFLASLLALALLLCPALAADVTHDYTLPVSVEAEAAVFSVTIPTSLPVGVAADGTVTVPNKVTITNNSPSPVSVSTIKVQPLNGWTLDDYASTTYGPFDVGKKHFAIQINGGTTNASTGAVTGFGLSKIPYNSSADFTYSAKVPMQKVDVNQQIANVVITVSWWHNYAVIF